jgi:hypothetical protein
MLANLDDCQAAYGPDFAFPMQVEMSIPQLVVTLGQPDYQFLMACLAQNVSFDDGRGQYFASPKASRAQAAAQPAQPIHFALQAGLIGFIASEGDLPFAFIRIQQTRLTWLGLPSSMQTTIELGRL